MLFGEQIQSHWDESSHYALVDPLVTFVCNERLITQ